MREKIIDHEEEFALASIENAGSHPAPIGVSNDPRFADSEQSPGPMFFRRLTLSEAVTQPLDAKLLS